MDDGAVPSPQGPAEPVPFSSLTRVAANPGARMPPSLSAGSTETLRHTIGYRVPRGVHDQGGRVL